MTNRPTTTWIFEPESFSPLGKLVEEKHFSIVTDHLGAPLTMHDESGDPVWSAEFGIYGKVFSAEPSTGCPFRWPGQYEDDETGLHYNRFRYYDPITGIYLSQDPIGLLGGTNSYAYASDITTWADPYGLSATYWLDKAMASEGRRSGPGQTAHHIVEQNRGGYAQASRDLLNRNGLHPDHPANGARLYGTHPAQVARAQHPGRTVARGMGKYHAGSTIHGDDAAKRIYRILRAAEKRGHDVEPVLRDIGRRMEDGSWPKSVRYCQ